MKLGGVMKMVIKFAPMAVRLARNEQLQQVLKIVWHMYSNRNQGQVSHAVINQKRVGQKPLKKKPRR